MPDCEAAWSTTCDIVRSMTTHELFFNPHGAKNLGKDTNTKAAMSH
jgi:hypothetical protein